MRATGPAPLRMLVASFLALIACGTLLLKLPAATPPGQPIGWIDALFTATSATCVTGLAVRDTGSGFTAFGQAVILGLIQAGGLGVMTFSLFIFALFRGRVSLAQRSIFEQTLASASGRELRPLLLRVFLFTFGIEAAGALALFVGWWPEMGGATAAWNAVFHSISAFCNAGFGLRPDSLTSWRGDAWTVFTVSALIILGGLGFFTLYDLARSTRSRFSMSVQTRLAVLVSAVLIVLGAALFWFLEAPRSLEGLGRSEQILAAFFQSVTARTAGFNTVDLALLSPGALFLMILLMFVGGSPGSCAGGIKTTTLAVLVVSSGARLRGHRNVNAFHRTLRPEAVRNALTIALAGVTAVIGGLFALLVSESPDAAVAQERAIFLDLLFETVSALATVGLTTGVTDDLRPASRLLVAAMMFIGRLGPLTVATAVATGRPDPDWQHPEEEVMVG